MRILHLLASPAFSGPAEGVALLALAQRALGHEVTVAVDRKRGSVASEEPAAPRLRELELLDEGGLELSVKSTPAAVVRDVLALRRREVQVVHAHFSHDHFLARVGRPRGAVLVRSVHSPRSLRFSMPAADAFTVPTHADARRLSGRKVMVLPALVGPEFTPASSREALRRELGVPGEPVIGMASTFQPSRRHELGVRAFAALRRERPRARLVLLGDGELEPAIRAQVASLWLQESVTFAGYQRGAAYVRWLQSLDELWVLGLGNDFAGRIAAQARACEVRVIAVDEGALGSVADAIVSPTPRSILEVSRSAPRALRRLPPSDEVAREVIALYQAGEVSG